MGYWLSGYGAGLSLRYFFQGFESPISRPERLLSIKVIISDL